jgi:hypothetical protein
VSRYNWKGGQTIHSGRVVVLAHGHHRATKHGYVRRAVLVLEAKLGRPLRDDEHAHHINSDKMDDRPENLEALTASEHAKLHNIVRRPDVMLKRLLSTRGSTHHCAKLKESDIVEIIRLRGLKTQREIAVMFGINQQNVSMIQLRQAWKHVTPTT